MAIAPVVNPGLNTVETGGATTTIADFELVIDTTEAGYIVTTTTLAPAARPAASRKLDG